MPNANWIKKTRGFSLIELMVITAIISLLMAIAIPNYIAYRSKAYCSQAETDADNVKSAISDYYSLPSHVGLPDVSDLKISTLNPVEISGDANTTITIIVTDRSGRCPEDYQNSSEQWNAAENKFTTHIN